MTKVCHISTVHKNTDARIFHKECNSLANAGYEVYLVAQGESGLEKNVQLIGLRSPLNRRDRVFRLSKDAFRKSCAVDADIYHIHDPELLPIALKLKNKGKIVIFDSHEDIFNDIKEKKYLPKLVRYTVSYILKIYCIIVLKKFDAIVTVTPHIYDALKKMNNNTWIITNFPVFVQKNTTYSRNKSICFAGGISRDWMHHNIIKALEHCNEVTYNLCGKVQGDYLEELQKIKGWNRVSYKGLISFDKVQDIYKQSAIGVALLDYMMNVGGNRGSIGNTKLFEYMMAGLPVVCTDFVLWKEIISKYNCGICIRPDDIDGIIEAINYLLNNPDVAEKMGQNGYAAVRDEFNWHNEEKKMLRLYEEVIKKDENCNHSRS